MSVVWCQARVLAENTDDQQTQTLVELLVVVQLSLGLVEQPMECVVLVVEASRASIDGADLTIGVGESSALRVDHRGPVLDEDDADVADLRGVLVWRSLCVGVHLGDLSSTWEN